MTGEIILDSWFSALDPTINGVSTIDSASLNKCLCHKHMQGVKKQSSYTSTRTCLLGNPRSRRGYSLGELHVPYFSKARAPNALREWTVNNDYISGYWVGRIGQFWTRFVTGSWPDKQLARPHILINIANSLEGNNSISIILEFHIENNAGIYYQTICCKCGFLYPDDLLRIW